jgi:acyl carrier protein
MTDHPTEEQIFAIVAEKVAAQKSIEVDVISMDSKFEDLGVDSLDAMEVLFELEEELDLDIPDTAARSMRTVSDVVEGLGKLARGEEIVLPDPPPVAEPAEDPAGDPAGDPAEDPDQGTVPGTGTGAAAEG